MEMRNISFLLNVIIQIKTFENYIEFVKALSIRQVN